jgi:beta-lactamase class A
MSRLLASLAAAAVLAVAADGGGSGAVNEVLVSKIVDRIRVIEGRMDGVLGFAVIDLATGQTVSWRGDTIFPQASSIKIPIMIEVFQAAREGRLKLDSAVTLERSDSVEGSGHLKILLRTKPVTLTVADLVSAMIETSDNTATNKLIALAEISRVNATLERIGFPKTRLRRIMLDTKAAMRGDENVSTPLEMARLIELIYRGKAVDPDASRQMLAYMKLVNADFRAAVPSNVEVASKPGELTGVRCETGVVLQPGRPFALSVMSTFLSPGENPVAEVVRIVYSAFEKLASSNDYGNRVR